MSDVGVESAVVCTDYADTLHILTYSYAAAAKDTLIVVTNEECCGGIERIVYTLTLEVACIAAVLVCEGLKLTAGGTGAGETLLLVVGKNKLEVGLSCSENLGSVGVDLHSVVNGIYASGNKSASAYNFNEAEAARADFVDILKVAESGNFYSGILRSLENS